MVLKNLVRYIINKYLKNYIEELDYEKLKVDLKNGHVCLEQLHLKPESLADLSLPVTVATGYLEKLTLIIPWKNLYHRPTKVHIEGLFMLIVPKDEVRRDFTDYYDDKMQRVQRKVDNLRKATLNSKLDEKDTTFLERMRLQIMRNLEITIRNLHISYETISTTKLGHPFSFGLTIYHLEMMTTTNHRPIGRIKENSLVIFKIKEMQALSLYWNTKCRSRIDMSFDDVVEDLKSKIATNTSIPKSDEMNYILYPVNLTIDLTITLQPGEYNFERPAYDIDIQIRELYLNIDPKQFSDLLDFIKFQNYSKLYDRCREYRELQFQLASGTSELTSEQEERIQYLESKLDVFNLAYIRHSVELEIQSLRPRRHSHVTATHVVSSAMTTSNNHKWYNSFWNMKNHSKQLERRKSSTSASETSLVDFFSEDSPNIDIKIKVKNLALNLTLPKIPFRKNEILCPIEITSACIAFKRRAISSNVLFIVDLQSLAIFGMKSDTQSRPLLATGVSISTLPVIHVELELSPMDKKSDYRLHLVIESLQITYDAPTINQIVACFDPNDDELESILPEIKRRTMEEMEEDLALKKIFDMTMQFKGISLLLPENGVRGSSSMVHMGFHSLILKSCLDDYQDTDVQQLRFYFKYKLRLSNLQITYSQSDKFPWHILRRIPFLDMNFYKCIYSNDAYLPDWRIVVSSAKMIEIELSKSILIELMQHLKSVPLLFSNLMETLHRINLYFTIFPPHTTVEVDLSIQRCLLLLTQFRTSILIDISSHLSKTRHDKSDRKDLQISLNNLTMAHSTIKSHSSSLFYQKQSLKLNYNNDLIERF